MLNLIKTGLEDIQQTFDIKEDLYEKYVENEIKKDKNLISLIQKRDNNFDWTTETPLGGAGTTLNACILYSLIRHHKIFSVLETGVSGGYYSSFMLSALKKNRKYYIPEICLLVSLELSNDKNKVGKLIPENLKENWFLHSGINSLEKLEQYKNNNGFKYQLYSHDSLHTMSHMLKELKYFQQCKEDKFFIFIDDEKSDNFWNKCLQINAFKKEGYKLKYISGTESRLKGHMGGFIQYVKA